MIGIKIVPVTGGKKVLLKHKHGEFLPVSYTTDTTAVAEQYDQFDRYTALAWHISQNTQNDSFWVLVGQLNAMAVKLESRKNKQ